jgi:hypothetical protein
MQSQEGEPELVRCNQSAGQNSHATDGPADIADDYERYQCLPNRSAAQQQRQKGSVSHHEQAATEQQGAWQCKQVGQEIQQ